MLNKCSILDIDRIIELGKLINNDFDKLNNISELISNDNIFGYYLDDKLVGFIVINKCYEVIDLLYIVVDKLYRNKSIGSKLMEYMINTFDYERIMLEVRCDNIYAIKLYKKYNFKIINIRKNYYLNNDAYVMEMVKWKMFIY